MKKYFKNGSEHRSVKWEKKGDAFVYTCKRCGKVLRTVDAEYMDNQTEVATTVYPEQLEKEHKEDCNE